VDREQWTGNNEQSTVSSSLHPGSRDRGLGLWGVVRALLALEKSARMALAWAVLAWVVKAEVSRGLGLWR